ncbi:nuclear transport factor 2 family protein [Fibrisoma montanum]|uniref:Nuclear transport factor 2 family protein n=1 Tax=Fibrisoma montanum TaxID=2305895 RepID=A0A418LXG5_9BACT|nr:nuclear transport factor 2 family protein [Fibrisoma montanum]RIV17954.1 nuclear transport factor 2 family protein [Fibrisoma montanum]
MKHFLTLCLIAVAPVAFAQSPAEKDVMNTEKRRFNALVSKDYTVLNQTLSDDLVYTHSNGIVDDKQSFIQSIKDGKLTYAAIDPLEQKVRLYGNTAIVNGVCQVKAVSNGETLSSRLRYTDVYVKKGNQWQLATWQSLRLTQ